MCADTVLFVCWKCVAKKSPVSRAFLSILLFGFIADVFIEKREHAVRPVNLVYQ